LQICATQFAALLALASPILGFACFAGAQESAAPKLGPQTNAHAFACTDYTQGKVFIVAPDGKIEWEY
jgi:hypothetical protein